MDGQIRKERREAMHRARAAAWEADKAEAQANKVICADHRFQYIIRDMAASMKELCAASSSCAPTTCCCCCPCVKYIWLPLSGKLHQAFIKAGDIGLTFDPF